MMMPLRINHKAVLVCIFLQQMVGLGWFIIVQPDIGHRFTRLPVQQFTALFIFVNLLLSSAITYTLALFYKSLQIETPGLGISIALLTWFIFFSLPFALFVMLSSLSTSFCSLFAALILSYFAFAGWVIARWRKYREPEIWKGYGYPGE